MAFVAWLSELGLDDVDVAGGKGAHLGSMAAAGLPVPNGFVVTAEAYLGALAAAGVRDRVRRELAEALEVTDAGERRLRAARLRELVRGAPIPQEVADAIVRAHRQLGDGAVVAVRSSATTEDSASASFAGVHSSSLGVRGADSLLDHVRACWASLFSERALAYRAATGLDGEPAMAVVVQELVAAERSGVVFTADPVTGDRGTLVVEAAFGLGDVVVGGAVQPDAYVVDSSARVLRSAVVGRQEHLLEPSPDGGVRRTALTGERALARVLDDDEVLELAALAARVAELHGAPQDLEWAMAGGRTYLVQSRPLTAATHGDGAADASGASEDGGSDGDVLVRGIAASPGRATGLARVLHDPDDAHLVAEGEVLVAPTTDPTWVPAMARAAAVVTDSGGVTCHAAIVSRELGVPCVVGARTATEVLTDGDPVTVDGSRGVVRRAARRGQSAGARDANARARSSAASRSASEVRPTST